jgi:nucleoside-diphosphate-sugar epimerase
VEIFHEAIKGKSYSCFLKPDASLPMLYMDDAIRATLELMQAPEDQIKIRTSYNLAGDSFSPAELAEAIRQHIPGFHIQYAPDFRQQIAESWPASIDDSKARADWGWNPRFDLSAMVRDMLERLAAHYVVKIPGLGTSHP